MAEHAQKYKLQVTGGPSYDVSTHSVIKVNQPNALRIEHDEMDIDLTIRVQDYRGYPDGSPSTSPYFSTEAHKQDRYSISFRMLPKKSKDATKKYKPIDGDSLVFGNDFDHPIKDKLPPGFNTAFRIVKWAIDPGLDGDAYADRPYLYGPVLSSMNTLAIPEKPGTKPAAADSNAAVAEPTESVADESKSPGWTSLPTWSDEPFVESVPAPIVPAGTTAAGRRKHFLTQANRTAFTYEPGQLHECDFFNPYLDFNEFALKLPGFSIHILRFLSSKQLKEDHTLRYVLKSKDDNGEMGGEGMGKVWFVVCLTLVLGKDDLVEGDEDEGKAGDAEKLSDSKQSEELAKDLKDKAKIDDPRGDDEGVD